jgi:hypothetical protein
MTARIHKAFNLLAGIHFDNKYYINSFELDLTFNVESESISEQNIALERVNYFLNECLRNSVFVNQNETEVIEKYMNAGMNVCSLPEDPYDQIVGIMLMVKLNNITEGRIILSDISIESIMSDGVSCLHSIEETVGPFSEKGWWSDNSHRINNFVKNKKVVKLSKIKNEWQSVFLDWKPQPNITEQAEIIFSRFDKTDK